jgi:hypothetical protein
MQVILNGDFSQEDLKEIAQVLRNIEQKCPEKHYNMFFDSRGTNLNINIIDVYPKLDNVDVDVTKIPWPKNG